MLLLVSGKDLHVVEVLDRAFITGLYVKLLEERICEVWCMGTGSCTEQKRRGERFGGVKDSRNVVVEGERLTPTEFHVSQLFRKKKPGIVGG